MDYSLRYITLLYKHPLKKCDWQQKQVLFAHPDEACSVWHPWLSSEGWLHVFSWCHWKPCDHKDCSCSYQGCVELQFQPVKQRVDCYMDRFIMFRQGAITNGVANYVYRSTLSICFLHSSWYFALDLLLANQKIKTRCPNSPISMEQIFKALE